MKTQLAAKEMETAVSGYWSGVLLSSALDGVYTDSRADGHGKLFLALKGERFDGHDFLENAAQNGAAALCVASDREEDAKKIVLPRLVVPDTLKAYQRLAHLYRKKFPRLTVAGVTGSVGKTSVKEMLRAIFTAASTPEEVLATEGNTNNQIGVPQNLFRLTERHRYAVIEMGTSSPGEIAPLSLTATPDVAVVNSIAPCHLEKLIDLAGVAREKASIISGLPETGTVVLPALAPEREVLAAACKDKKIIWFGNDASCDFYSEYLGGDLTESRFCLHFPDGGKFEIAWHLGGAHQALNAAAAAAAAWSCGIDASVIAKALPLTQLPGMRMKRTQLDGITYLNDAYNANPASMKATLTQLFQTRPDEAHLVIVLGGMRELGSVSVDAHRETLELAKTLFPRARIITVGAEFAGSPAPVHFADSVRFSLKEYLNSGDLVFLKGSRGTALEKLIPEEAR
ncbi:MAG: UDP-N-acetylmuramoyl-tripeptide--D-alanyl-D-alanine ligase [Victivallaceae bacterium]|nr:UDP-N-acetylmuramoyl-tripeptide--D-alanyl-D-alanine ligase [Victivallaceae bacterium]